MVAGQGAGAFGRRSASGLGARVGMLEAVAGDDPSQPATDYRYRDSPAASALSIP